MASNLSLSFVVTAETAAAQRQLRQLQEQLRGVGGVKISDPTAPISSGASAAAGALRGVLAGLLAVGAAAAGAGAALRKGFEVNSQIEDAQLGVKALLAALGEVRDAQGNLATGPEALAIAGEESKRQLEALRIEGLKTTATFTQLVQTYQTALGPGLAAGFDPTQVRDLTVGITQAASSLGLGADQLKSEINALFTGDLNLDSDLANRIGITREQVAEWKAAGPQKFYEELNKQVAIFKLTGDEAATTWTGMLSNAADAADLFFSKMSEGAFDEVKRALGSALGEVFQDGQISDSFQGLFETGSQVFDGLGQIAADVISGIVSALQSVSEFLSANADTVGDIAASFGVVYDLVKETLGSVLSLVGATGAADGALGLLAGTLKLAALAAAAISDGVRAIAAAAAFVGGKILDFIGKPLRAVVGGLRDLLSQIPGIGGALASAVDSLLRGIPADGGALSAYAESVAKSFMNGKSAIAQTSAELSKTAKQRREEQAELQREANRGRRTTGGTVTGRPAAPPAPPKGPSAADSAKRAAEEYAKALEAYVKAEADAAKTASEAVRSLAEAELEASLDRRLISQEQYLREKARLESEAVARDLATARAAAAKLEAEASAATDPAAKKRLEGDLLKARAEITALEKRGAVVAVKLDADIEGLQREIDSLRIDLRANILDLEGSPLEATLARIQQEADSFRNDPRVANDADFQAGVARQASLRAQRAQFDEQRRLIEERAQLSQLAEERIALAVQTGQKTALEGEREVRAARLAQAEAILANVEALERLAGANPANSELALAAQRARLEYDKLRGSLDETASSINRDLAGSVSGFIQGIADGENAIRSLGNALADVFGNIAKRFLKQFEDDLFNALQGANGQGLGGLFSGLLGGGSGADFFSGLGSLLGFANGGYTGPGNRLDPAGVVHRGEFVFDAASVRRLGLPFLYSLQRSYNRPRMPGYADGGLVGGGVSKAMQGAFNPTIQNSLNLSPQLYLDRGDLVRALADTPEHERLVANVVFVKNAGKLG